MRAAVQAMLVAHHSILKIDFERQAALTKQFQGPIDGRIPDAWILLLDKLMKILCAQVVPGVQEHLEYPIPLCALLQALVAQVSCKNPLGYFQPIVARDWWIVNPLLR